MSAGRYAPLAAVVARAGARPALVVLAVCALAVLLMRKLAFVWAGDALIHLRIAELFAQGHLFEFNRGERVVATSSLLWTVLLAGLFKALAPGGVVAAVKALSLASWAGASLLSSVVWSRLFGFRWAGVAAGAAFALSPGLFHNAVHGMEAPLAAVVVTTLFGLCFGALGPVGKSPPPGAALGLSAALVLLRPEGAVFVALLAAASLWPRPGGRRLWAGALLVGAGLAAATTAAVYLHFTGTLSPDSGAARVAAGLRQSVTLGPLRAHPHSALLALLYAPATLGLLSLGGMVVGRGGPSGTATAPGLRPAAGLALTLGAALLFLYTFIIGASHASRYWLPFLPVLLGGGVAACVAWARHHWRPRRSAALALVLASAGWLGTYYVLDWQRRLRQALGDPHGQVAQAVEGRAAFTREFLRKLGVEPTSAGGLKVAMTEVQLRYYLDEVPVSVLSLDGRTSNGFRRYIDERTGLRRFDLYLREVRPDYVELDQLHPREPVLPEALALLASGAPSVEVDGFRFTRTQVPLVYRVEYRSDR